MPRPDLNELRSLAVALAERAAAIHRDGRERGFAVAEKSNPANLVTEVDEAAEREIVEGIVAARPGDAILGEEGTDRPGSSGVRWVIDPLDGTASYVRGYPTSCVSIGVEIDGAPALGVVVDAIGRRTEGIVGEGAVRDGRPIRPSTRLSLDGAILATGFGYEVDQRVDEARALVRIIGRVADIRRSGSAAFDLVAAACGEVDAYYEPYLAPWDIAAGRAIVLAAGGAIRELVQPGGGILTVAGPSQLLESLLEVLFEAGFATG